MLGRESEAELAANDLDIVLHPPTQTTTRVVRELGVENLDQANTGHWQDIPPSLIVAPALFASMHATDGNDVRLIEVGHGHDVLSLAVFDNQLQIGPIPVDRKANPEPGGITGIATEEIESRLAVRSRSQDLITEIEDVVLVALLLHGLTGSPNNSRSSLRVSA